MEALFSYFDEGCRVLERPVKPLRDSGERGALLWRLVTNCDQEFEWLPLKLL
jgi:hypothetical protein